jgi:hypothetical protein
VCPDLFNFVILGLVKKNNLFLVSLYFLFASVLISCDNSEVTYWDVIDQNSILVFETIHVPTTAQQLLIPYLRVSSTAFAVSLQSISKNEFDLLYSYSIPEKEYSLLTKENTVNQGNYKIDNRFYSGFEIREIRNEANSIVLAFAYIKGVFVVSESVLLIENAIRVFENKDSINFKTRNRDLFQFASIKSDAGNLFVNFSQASRTLLASSSLRKTIPFLANLAESSMLDVNVEPNLISMSGFTLDSTNTQGLSVFNGQRAVRSNLARFVPNYSNSFVCYGVSDPVRFKKELGVPNKLAINFGNEVAIFSLNPDQSKYIAIVALGDESGNLDSGAYEEAYSGYEIRSLQKQPLAQAFRNLIPTKSFEYFTQQENFVFLANEPDELKLMIDAIEADNTWGKSIAFQKFYQRGLQESNVSIFFKEPVLSENEKWKPLLDSLGLSSLAWASIQFSALDNHFYTSANLASKTKEVKSTDQIKSRLSYRLPNFIDRGFAVRNQITGGSEVVLQDSTFKIHLFNPTKGILWQSQLDGMIQDINQIDYYKNNKLQYLISTRSSLYLIDRLGRDVEGFPKKLSMLVNSMELVDYDKSRNYRYLIQSSNSDVYILDKDGKPLEGWSPNHFPFSIKDKPKHYRIGGKDYFVMLSVDGFIYLVNRKGDVEKKIPLTYKSYWGDYVLEMGTNLATSFLQYVSLDGVVYRQSLDGKNASQENLVKGNGSKFLLKRTAVGTADFFFFRMDTDKIAIFDKQRQLVIERQNSGSSQLIPSVVRLSDKAVIFCFYDLEQKLFFLYDQLGNLIGNRPIESTRAPIFGGDNKGKKIVVYSIDSDVLTTTPLN